MILDADGIAMYCKWFSIRKYWWYQRGYQKP